MSAPATAPPPPPEITLPGGTTIRTVRDETYTCGLIFLLPDGRAAAVQATIFGCKLVVSGEGCSDLRQGYADAWCYQEQWRALCALLTWIDDGALDEPTDWHRHPGTGRYRYKGDPARPYDHSEAGREAHERYLKEDPDGARFD
jgi:hypothetical protein